MDPTADNSENEMDNDTPVDKKDIYGRLKKLLGKFLEEH